VPARNRIKGHITLKARDLIPHELNPRTHSDAQRAALYEQIGFARSLLAYEVDSRDSPLPAPSQRSRRETTSTHRSVAERIHGSRGGVVT
jgi:hypothetical protein